MSVVVARSEATCRRDRSSRCGRCGKRIVKGQPWVRVQLLESRGGRMLPLKEWARHSKCLPPLPEERCKACGGDGWNAAGFPCGRCHGVGLIPTQRQRAAHRRARGDGREFRR